MDRIPNFGRVRRNLDEPYLWRHVVEKRLQQFIRKIKPQVTIQQQLEVYTEFRLTLFHFDLLFKILILLPAQSIYNLQFVCKNMFDFINSSIFIQSHTKQSDTVLISKEPFIYGSPLPFTSSLSSKHYLHYVDFDSGNDNFIELSANSLVNIQASYDGLILGVIEKNNGLILMNPLTRKHTRLPLGTIGFDESYSLVFCCETRSYKVVHLFRESSTNTTCEILDISTRRWTIVDGPCSDLLVDIKLMPVCVDGTLNWLPRGHGFDSYLSMNVMDEKFVTKKLPIVCALNDRLVDIGGVLGFVTHATLNLVQVWILSGENEKWIKRYSVYMKIDVRSVVPICSRRNGEEMVFEYPGKELYVYKLKTGDMKKIYSREDEQMETRSGAEQLFIPHRNTFVSWNRIQLR